MRRLNLYPHLLALIILLSFVLSLSACGTAVGKVTVIPRPTISNVGSIGLIEVKAKCLDNEQMLSSGYTFDRPSNPGASSLAVEASYPSMTNEWTVDFFNPDSDTNGPNSGAQIIATAYCITTPNFQAGMTIRSNSGMFTTTGPSRIATSCPTGAAVTGGGFKIDHVLNDQIFNANISASEPHLDNVGTPGWDIQGQLFGVQNMTANVTVYALCATMQLTSAPFVSNTTQITPGGPVLEEGQSPPCGTNQLLTGGGYNLNVGIARGVYYDAVSAGGFSAWSVKEWVVLAGNYVENITTWATCVNVPA